MTHEQEIATLVECVREIANASCGDGLLININKMLDGISRDDGENAEPCKHGMHERHFTSVDGIGYVPSFVCRYCGTIGRHNGREIEWWPALPAELPPDPKPSFKCGYIGQEWKDYIAGLEAQRDALKAIIERARNG